MNGKLLSEVGKLQPEMKRVDGFYARKSRTEYGYAEYGKIHRQ